MARPTKEGLDYFELDCRMDEKMEMIEAQYGLKGFAVVVKLYQHIYQGHGYYCEWSPDISFLWAARCSGSHGDARGNVGNVFPEGSALSGFPKNLINEIVEASIRRGIFSGDMFKRYGILTSSGIQKRYLNAVTKRKDVKLEKRYLLIDVPENRVSSVNNSINSVNNSVNSVNNPQIREDKIREEYVVGDIGYINTPVFQTTETPTPTPADLAAIEQAWNAIPHAVRISSIRPMTRRYDETRICMDMYGHDGLIRAIGKVRDSPYLKKKGRVSFDNYINRNAVQKLLEGSYDDDYEEQKGNKGNGFEFDW